MIPTPVRPPFPAFWGLGDRLRRDAPFMVFRERRADHDSIFGDGACPMPQMDVWSS